MRTKRGAAGPIVVTTMAAVLGLSAVAAASTPDAYHDMRNYASIHNITDVDSVSTSDATPDAYHDM